MVATQVVELNVGGYCFTTLRSTLCKHEDSMLSRMFAGDLAPAYQDTQGRYFIDRDGTHFGIVLAYLRGQPLQLPSSLADRSALVAEALFYQVYTLDEPLILFCTFGITHQRTKYGYTWPLQSAKLCPVLNVATQCKWTE